MLTFIFFCAMFYIFGQIFFCGLKGAWGLTKLIFTIFFWPVILIALVIYGLIYIAIPILAIIGLISLVNRKSY